MPVSRGMGIYPSDSVAEVAASLPLDPLASGSADVLASDIEYRIHLILQEAKKFMVHAKRGTLMPEDVEYAMEALNVEPVLVPPRSLPAPAFAPVPHSSTGSTSTAQLYHVPDEEIDFATYLKQPLPPGLANSAGVKWKAHWLAVEGVQPAIAENPAPSARAGPSRTPPQPTTGNAALRPSAKTQLPQELQLYFSRLTSSLVPAALPILPAQPSSDGALLDADRHRLAALASLRSDAAVAGILVYLVKWFAESIQKCLMSSTGVIAALIDGVEALLSNEQIFLEPYLHQLLAPMMSILLTVPLGPHPPSSSSGQPSPFDIRTRAAEVLGQIAKTYGSTYEGLVPRLVSTFTDTLNSSPFPSPLGAQNPPAGRYEGVLLGVACLSPRAARSFLLGSNAHALTRIDGLAVSLYPGQEGRKGKNPLIKAGTKALAAMVGPKPETAVAPAFEADAIGEEMGWTWVRGLEKRPWLASEVLRMKREAGERVKPEINGSGSEVHGEMEVD